MLIKITKSTNLILLFCITAITFIFCQPTEQTVATGHPEWAKDEIIYEVNIRQYSEAGTFNAFAEQLPRLQKMGVGILWLMPINPIGVEGRKGTLGSYYAVKDYKAVNPEYGTLDDLKKLVGKTHELGMHVIIDWVANHTSPDNVWTKTHPEYYSKDSLGNFYPPVPDWHDVIDLNYDNKDLRTAMTDAMKYWVEECDIDGFRCDVASMVPNDFWKEAITELKKVKHVFMLAEASEAELHDAGFDMTYSWGLKDVMNDVAKGNKNAESIAEYFVKEQKNYKPDDYRMLFTTNHDENSWNGTAYERFGDGANTFSVLCGTAKGMLLIYSGQESKLNKQLQFFEKDPIEWDDYPLEGFYTKLADVKKENKALWNGSQGGEMVRINTSNDEKIYAFYREKDGDKVIVILNLSGEDVSAAISNEILQGNFKEIFTDSPESFYGSFNKNLKPWQYLVFVN